MIKAGFNLLSFIRSHQQSRCNKSRQTERHRSDYCSFPLIERFVALLCIKVKCEISSSLNGIAKIPVMTF